MLKGPSAGSTETTRWGKQIHPPVLESVLMSFLGGHTHTSYSFLGDTPKTTYQRYEKVVCRAIEEVTADQFKLACQRIRGENLRLYCASNGAWTHRGWKARASTFVLRIEKATDTLGNPIKIDAPFLVINLKKSMSYLRPNGSKVHIAGNYSGTSKGMENEALCRTLRILEENDILSHIESWCMDEDSSSRETIEAFPETSHITLSSDAGHKKSNFLRSLAKILTGKRYATLAKRIATWYLTLIKRVERECSGLTTDDQAEREKRFNEYWAFTKTHYTTQACSNNCPCKYDYPLDQRVTDEECERVLILFEKLSLMESPVSTGTDPVTPDHSATSSDTSISTSSLATDTSTDSTTDTSIDTPTSTPSNLRTRFYFDLTNDGDAEKWDLLQPILQTAVENVGDALWMLNTIKCEGANSRRLVFLRKDRFLISTHEARSSISALKEILGMEKLATRLAEKILGYSSWISGNSLSKLQQKDIESAKDRSRKQSSAFKKHSSTLTKNNSRTKKETESHTGFLQSLDKMQKKKEMAIVQAQKKKKPRPAYLNTADKTQETVVAAAQLRAASRSSSTPTTSTSTSTTTTCASCKQQGHSRKSSKHCPNNISRVPTDTSSPSPSSFPSPSSSPSPSPISSSVPITRKRGRPPKANTASSKKQQK
jgi:hypothetical protein